MMRLVLPVIAAMALPSSCFADAGVDAAPRATVAGEVEKPGRFELTKAATLSAVFSEITKPLSMGATTRIRVYRNGTRRDYDVKKFGDVAVVDGDIVEVPIKYVHEGQAEDRAVPVFCEDPKTTLEQVVMLKSDRWKTQTNWREGIDGIEFRPTGKLGAHGGISVFVRAATQDELARIVDEKGRPAPKNFKALLVICRDFGRRESPSEFELKLVARIQSIVSQRNQPSEPQR